LRATRRGEIDPLVVDGAGSNRGSTLESPDEPYRNLVEQMQEGAVTLTHDGTILYANHRFAQMVKARLEKVIGSQLQSFIRAGDQAGLAAVLASRDASTVQYVLSAGDGSFIPVQLSFHQLPVEDVEAISLVVTDLTEQQEKRELADALSNLRAAQEQLQRQNDELQTARAAAEAASDAKDNFLAALSHELRTPLTPVLLTIAAMESDDAIPQSLRRDLKVLRRNVELEARLIDDLLDLTRIVHGKVELQPEVSDVHAVLDAALEIARPEIDAKGLQLVRDLRAVESHIAGDVVRIQQVLWNLVRNAAKFTPAGGRVIVRSDGDGSMIRISIADTGIGIDPESIGKIFTPFEQADRSVTRQFGGLGLGLTISKRLAEMHGGTITAASDGPGKGSTFTLTLPTVGPAGSSATNDTRSVARLSRSTNGGNYTPKRLRILLVEDHDDTRRSMARLLGRNHHVCDVESIALALAAAQTQSFDLVISDLGLPDGSGLDLMRRLRQQHGLTGICLTGYGMEDDLAQSNEAGFRLHLTKPVDLRKLETAIEDATAS